jgi:hypothetical protein
MSKYHAKKTTVDGISFSSKKEAAYYVKLKLDVASGKVKYFLRQVPLHLPGNIRYVVDFIVVYLTNICEPGYDDAVIVDYIDCKGFKTDVYKMKKKLVEATYPIKIIEV